MLPAREELMRLLEYNREAGDLIWRERKIVTHGDKRFNGRYAGKRAGTFAKSNGKPHVAICLDGSKHQAHRIIVKMEFGIDARFVDHVNGDATDNRLCNLRPCTLSQNQGNRGRNNGRSLPKCVRQRGPWRFEAYIGTNKKYKHLGVFRTADAASAAYLKAAEEHFGKFARRD